MTKNKATIDIQQALIGKPTDLKKDQLQKAANSIDSSIQNLNNLNVEFKKVVSQLLITGKGAENIKPSELKKIVAKLDDTLTNVHDKAHQAKNELPNIKTPGK